jgi:hypothetical protein
MGDPSFLEVDGPCTIVSFSCNVIAATASLARSSGVRASSSQGRSPAAWTMAGMYSKPANISHDDRQERVFCMI